VFSAQEHLARLEVRFIALKIGAKAEELALSDAQKAALQDFARFRSQRLGHAGPTSTEVERAQWVGEGNLSAFGLAREFLATYVDQLRGVHPSNNRPAAVEDLRKSRSER